MEEISAAGYRFKAEEPRAISLKQQYPAAAVDRVQREIGKIFYFMYHINMVN